VDFAWTPEQHHAHDQARLFALREFGAKRPEPRGGFLDAWHTCAQFGLQALNIPAAYGGLGLDARSAVHVLEGFGAGCRDNGLLMSLGAQLWSVAMPLIQFGSEEQKRLWLPALAQGKSIGAFALTEPESGSDVFHLRTRALADAAGFRLEGAKCFVTNAPVADLFLVFAATDANAGYFGLTAFLLRRDLAGLELGPPLQKMGLESSPMSELRFDALWTPRESVLGEVGGGGAVLMNTLEWERGCLLAPALGTMDRLLQETTQFLRLRKQFGRPVIEFEAVGQHLAELRLRLELSRLLAYQFAWMKDQNLSAALQASMTKLYLSESLRRASELAVHLHGAAGYLRDLDYECTWRDAMASSLYSGTTEMQHNLIAEGLLRHPAPPPPPRVEEAAQ